MVGLEVVVDGSRVVFLDHAQPVFVVRHKWRHFYALVISANGSQVDRSAVGRLQGWPDDALANGREIARHLKSVKFRQLASPPILSDRPTLGWRFNPLWKLKIETPDGLIDVSALLKPPTAIGPSKFDACAIAEVKEACDLISSQLDFYAGNIRCCFERMLKIRRASLQSELQSVALFWLLRSAQRLPADDALLDLLEQAEEQLRHLPAGPIVQLMQERSALCRSLTSPSSEWPKLARSLDRIFTVPRSCFDLTNWVYAGNYAALVQRRLGRLNEAQQRILSILAATVATGDVYIQQIVLFNAALIISDRAKQGPPNCPQVREWIQAAISALKIVSRISDDFGVGKDSAQNEILIAELHIRARDWTAARASMDLAHELLEINENLCDQAALQHCEGVFLASQAALRSDMRSRAAEHFDAAIDLFIQCGRDDMVVNVRADRVRLMNSRQSRIE